ncbi:hypothetical protein ACFLUU_01930 [Chloroflexota bacterium]
MESSEEEYRRSIWEIYRKEWETASPEKRVELNKRMNSWQELMKDGLSARQAYDNVMGEESDDTPIYKTIEEESGYRVREGSSDKRQAIPSALKMRKVPLVFLGLALVAAIVYSVVITGDRNALNTDKATLESEKATLVSEKATLVSEKATLVSDKATLESEKANLEENVENLGFTIEKIKSDLDSAKGEITSLKSDLIRVKDNYNVVLNELTELKTFYDGIFKGKTPDYLKLHDPDVKINLTENASANDPTWQQLVDFLSTDLTDSRKYVLGEYVCTGFMEDLHNNAEALGIRSAAVFVTFEDSEEGHTLNAFNTVDRGLVFIDNTGVSGSTNRAWDRVAYLRIGEQYGVITTDAAIESFEYEYYGTMVEQLQDRIDKFEESVERYNNELDDYNLAVQIYNNAMLQADNSTSWQETQAADLYRFERWLERLDSMVSALEQESAELGIQYDQYGVLGIVKEVEMYW